jgi:hypothetical protein
MSVAVSNHREAYVSSISPSLTKVNTDAFSNTAKIVRHPKIDLAKTREAYRLACVEAIKGAFPASSQHACCKAAGQRFGEHWSKFNRILDGETAQPEATLMLAVGAIYTRRTGKVSPIAALQAQLEELL